MDITEVRIKLTDEAAERLRAFCSVTFDDCFVVRDLKIIEGANGPFVAMPSRKLTFHCPECRGKNHLRASYCNTCGRSLKEHQPAADEEGRIKLYADIAHPINSFCRELIQDRVIEAYQQELEEAQQPGYVSHYDELDEDWDEEPGSGEDSRGQAARPVPSDRTDKVGTDKAGAPEGPRTRADQQPRGPHRKPQTKTSTPGRQKPPDTFGAGIF